MIESSPKGEACVCDLTAPLDLSQPTISHHLKILVKAGILAREKRGLWAWYSVVPEQLETLRRLLPGPAFLQPIS
ncbi:metalloregulator ArsR/SmtB family transcription factor [Kribbella sp. NBC_01245]|uniref:ArsR/SmtB family transcription factor n=1 Tax=Kribbella sp. NBC_01245 TaxID=2903578 RepID=UPI002E284D32|nr:metalloregulator ArsR/SmtB family transcription factor [Kribbella sp. NBC_01245]